MGCVSRNYTDGKWRIACADAYPGSPTDRTFKSRGEAAQAEWDAVQAAWAKIRASLAYAAYIEAFKHLPADVLDKLATYAHVDEKVRVAARDSR